MTGGQGELLCPWELPVLLWIQYCHSYPQGSPPNPTPNPATSGAELGCSTHRLVLARDSTVPSSEYNRGLVVLWLWAVSMAGEMESPRGVQSLRRALCFIASVKQIQKHAALQLSYQVELFCSGNICGEAVKCYQWVL